MSRVDPCRKRRDMRRQDRMEVELRVGPTSQAMVCQQPPEARGDREDSLWGLCGEHTDAVGFGLLASKSVRIKSWLF